MSNESVEQLKIEIKNLNAQLDTTKQMFNEQLMINLNLKTNINLLQEAYQQHYKEAIDKIAECKKEIQDLKNKITEYTA